MTSLIKHNRSFREAVKALTVRPEISKASNYFVEPKTKQYMLVGTAFDCLVGYTIEHLSGSKVRSKSSLVADRSLAIMRHDGGDEAFLAHVQNAQRRVDHLKDNAEKFIKSGQLNHEFASGLIEVSQLDQIYRAGLYPRLPLPRASKKNVEDLVAMYNIMPVERLTAMKSAFIAPDFGHSSQLVGGADADFIIDGALLDTKTTIKKSIPLAMWCQVVGYYLLNHIEKTVGNPYIDIDRIGIYFSRYGEICEVSVKESIKDPETLTLIMMGHPTSL